MSEPESQFSALSRPSGFDRTSTEVTASVSGLVTRVDMYVYRMAERQRGRIYVSKQQSSGEIRNATICVLLTSRCWRFINREVPTSPRNKQEQVLSHVVVQNGCEG